MSVCTAKYKFNIDKSKWGEFDRVFLNLPHRVRGRNISPSARALLERVFSFTKRVKEEQEDGKFIEELHGSRFTYAQVMSELGRGHSTVAASFDELRDADLIKRVDRDVEGTEYVYVGDRTAGKYFVVPLYLRTMQLFIDGEYRQIRQSEVRVCAYLMSECSSPTNGGDKYGKGGVCWTSYRKLARKLHLSCTAVRRAISALFEAGMVYRTKARKGKSFKHLSGYEVNAGLFIYRNYVKKARTPEEESTVRYAYYAELREWARLRAEKYMAIAAKSEAYKRNRASFARLEVQEAKAEVFGTGDIREIKARRKTLERDRDVILSHLGLTVEDLTVQYNCARCKDEGRTAQGAWCTCYPGGSPP